MDFLNGIGGNLGNLGSTLGISGISDVFGSSKGGGDGEGEALPLFRLTVLGSGESGKTSLVSSWVNSFCPTAYVPTEECTLYYRTARIRHPGDEEAILTVLVEIEDVYSYENQTKGDKANEDWFSLLTPRQETKKLGTFSGREAPKRGDAKAIGRYRMGFLVVCDVTNEDSCKTATKICSDLKLRGPDVLVYLAANKVDKDPLGARTQANLRVMRSFAEESMSGICLWEVSALEYTRVNRVFRELLEDIAVHEVSTGTGAGRVASGLSGLSGLRSAGGPSAGAGEGKSGEECALQ